MNEFMGTEARPGEELQRVRSLSSYLIVTLDRLQLLLPQHQVYALEPTFEVTYPEGDTLGQIALEGMVWPVCCLSEELEPMHRVPSSRHICVLLHTDTGLFGLLCDQVVLTKWSGEVARVPLPACMQTPDSRVRGLVLQGERILCMTSTEDLLACAGVGPSPTTQPHESPL